MQTKPNHARTAFVTRETLLRLFLATERLLIGTPRRSPEWAAIEADYWELAVQLAALDGKAVRA